MSQETTLIDFVTYQEYFDCFDPGWEVFDGMAVGEECSPLAHASCGCATLPQNTWRFCSSRMWRMLVPWGVALTKATLLSTRHSSDIFRRIQDFHEWNSGSGTRLHFVLSRSHEPQIRNNTESSHRFQEPTGFAENHLASIEPIPIAMVVCYGYEKSWRVYTTSCVSIRPR